MSPEQTEGSAATSASDVFSFGLILYELLTGIRSFGDRNILEILKLVRSIEPGTYADPLEEPFRSLVRKMLVRAPADRTITMAEIEAILAA